MSFDLNRVADSDHLLDVLLQMEDVLDGLDLYVYENWFDGVLESGPHIQRYLCTFSLLYPYRKMPDPRGALRLLRHDILVRYELVRRPGEPMPGAPQQQHEDRFWMVTIQIPRRLLDLDAAAETEDDEDDTRDKGVDPDDVTDAEDAGLGSESAYMNRPDMGAPPGPDMGGPPGAPPGGGNAQQPL